MKRSSALLLLWSCLVSLYAQEYQPFPTEGAVWSEARIAISDYLELPPSSSHLAPAGDTLIGGETYARLFRSEDSIFTLTGATYVGAYRNGEKEVLFVYAGIDTATVLYDFSMEEGDTLRFTNCDQWPLETCPFLVVTAEENIILGDGSERRMLSFSLYADGEWVPVSSWVEGIGSTWGFMNSYSNFLNDYLPIDPVYESHLLCFEEAGFLQYTHPLYYEGSCYLGDGLIDAVGSADRGEGLALFPNPAGDLLQLEITENRDYQYAIFHLSGRALKAGRFHTSENSISIQELPAGMYWLVLSCEEGRYVRRFVKGR